jgi:hypothetical protein
MTATTLLISLLVVLALVLVLAVAVSLIKKQRQAQPWPPPEHPLPRPAAPAANPRLHDATLLSAEASGSASDPRAGVVRQVTVVAGAPQQTYALQLGRPLMIGRHSSHGIAFTNPRVSRDHARLVVTNGTVQITDLGSTNGTFVGEQKRRLAPHTPELLAPGEVFWIGPDIQLIVDAAQEPGSPKQER